MDRMLHRAGAMLGALAIALLASGCTPEPTPTPSPTGFASEEEAFAAAEATYRAYVDAVNARRADPTSAMDPQGFLTGVALEADIDGQRTFVAEGLSLQGDSIVSAVAPSDWSLASSSILVCINVSQTRLVNRDGVDVTPYDRADKLGLEATVIWVTPEPLISSTTATDSAC